MVRTILIKLIYLFDILLPKNNSLIILSSYPDYSHNSLALFLYLIKNNYHDKYKIIWLVRTLSNRDFLTSYVHKNTGKNLNEINSHKQNSLTGVFYYLRSKYIFYTHGLYRGSKFSSKKIIVNLWHGMPIKDIGLGVDFKDMNDVLKFNFVCISSNYYFSIFQKIFGISKSKVKVTGQPVSELLFQPKKNFFLNKNFNIKNKNKLFIWMPTWRISNKSTFFKNPQDSNVSHILKEIDIFPLIKKISDLIKIDNLLKQNNNFLLIKKHILQKDIHIDKSLFSNIFIFDDDFLYKQNINIYELLPYTDILISDYSSIIIDYLLLKKPIVAAINNKETYQRNIDKKIFNEIYLKNNQIFNFNKLCKLFSNKINLQILENNLIKKYNIYEKNISKNILELVGL